MEVSVGLSAVGQLPTLLTSRVAADDDWRTHYRQLGLPKQVSSASVSDLILRSGARGLHAVRSAANKEPNDLLEQVQS